MDKLNYDLVVADARALIDRCTAAGVLLATAESCTGGLIAALLTEIAGASAVLERGFVTYSNQAKTDLLGVPETLIATEGAVSEAVARAMAAGALSNSGARLGIAVTGIAGPDGGSPEKPVGLVHLAAARKAGRIIAERYVFPGSRQQIRLQAARQAMRLAASII